MAERQFRVGLHACKTARKMMSVATKLECCSSKLCLLGTEFPLASHLDH